MKQGGSLPGQCLCASCLLTRGLERYFRACPFLEHFCHALGDMHLPANLPDGDFDTASLLWSFLCFYLRHRSFFLLVTVTLFEKFDTPQECQLWPAKVSLTQSLFFTNTPISPEAAFPLPALPHLPEPLFGRPSALFLAMLALVIH